MLRFRHYGLFVGLLAATACQKSTQEQETQALRAQEEADKTMAKAAQERREEVNAAQEEAAKKIGSAQQEARKETNEALKEERDTARKAQVEANEEARDAVRVAGETRADIRKDVQDKLDDIDRRAADLRKEWATSKVAAKQNIGVELTDVENQSKSMRLELTQLDKAAPNALEQTRQRLEKNAADLKQRLDRIDDQI